MFVFVDEGLALWQVLIVTHIRDLASSCERERMKEWAMADASSHIWMAASVLLLKVADHGLVYFAFM